MDYAIRASFEVPEEAACGELAGPDYRPAAAGAVSGEWTIQATSVPMGSPLTICISAPAWPISKMRKGIF